MGNSFGRIPFLVQETVLSFLTVQEAKQLMHTSRAIRRMVAANRAFWAARALRLYDIDSALFLRLKDPLRFNQETLVKHVCAAHDMLLDIQANIRLRAQNGRDSSLYVRGRVNCVSVDERACLIAVAVEDFKVRVYSLLRFGDPPLRVIDYTNVDQLILHGNILFTRPAQNSLEFFLDSYNWKMNLEMASLAPTHSAMQKFYVKKSEQYLVAYNHFQHATKAYPLVENGFSQSAVKIQFAPHSVLQDFLVRGGDLLAIFVIACVSTFQQYRIATGELIKEFLVAYPADFHSPRLAYPYVLVTQKPPSTTPIYLDDYFLVFGTCMDLNRPNSIPENRGRIIASGKINDTSSNSQFLALVDYRDQRNKIVYLDRHDYLLRVIESVECSPSYCFASFGLSYIFARGSVIFLRRFYDMQEIVSL